MVAIPNSPRIFLSHSRPSSSCCSTPVDGALCALAAGGRGRVRRLTVLRNLDCLRHQVEEATLLAVVLAPDQDVATSENDICLEEINQMSRHVATFA